ncbi:substrate-binding periplasmic protein [Marinimicrobium agarilyticum]|uniref:substrate-binding periplasmic protein n=1 Tax=Marinimicrobium agarilyticum TaxID=306546 RepID=UPI0004195C15|nr:transporter substrate-binding domain-containing protein [Marinimicrobium agarilyticum]
MLSRVRVISGCCGWLLSGVTGCLQAQAVPQPPTVVKIPHMEVAGLHRQYANALLEMTLTLSERRYGPYELVRQTGETVIKRQLLELENGDNLSVAISMPMPEWLEKTERVPLPIMKGLASYRLFLARRKNVAAFNAIDNLDALKKLRIGQGPGWSTGKILEDGGFKVVYGGPYPTLLPMLNADRFDLLMRSVYEAAAELKRYQPDMPELAVVDGIALYTYLPMYFFVSKTQPVLAERIEYGLALAYKNGQLDELFNRYFSGSLAMLNLENRRVFYLPNTNIDPSFYESDKPYLLKSVQAGAEFR